MTTYTSHKITRLIFLNLIQSFSKVVGWKNNVQAWYEANSVEELLSSMCEVLGLIPATQSEIESILLLLFRRGLQVHSWKSMLESQQNLTILKIDQEMTLQCLMEKV